MEQERPHIILIDDHKLVAQALSHVLSSEYRVTLAANQREMRLAMRQTRFAVALLDLFLANEGDGLSLLPELLNHNIKVLVFADASDKAAIRASITMGAHGYVDKAGELHQLRAALKAVMQDHLAFPQELLSAALREPRNIVPQLSEREVRLLDMMLAEPMPSNEDMAKRLFISIGRVKNCLTDLYAKFNVQSRHALVAEARRRGYFIGMHPARMAGGGRRRKL
ncbi:response regulator transcription factor [Massilia sp. W12]|uniref:response regulator transcription factor n=1 Tax=Massilia sp. W12 TaxID=3126507 RepID=UPI0030D39959